jgi:hypothetical protein
LPTPAARFAPRDGVREQVDDRAQLDIAADHGRLGGPGRQRLAVLAADDPRAAIFAGAGGVAQSAGVARRGELERQRCRPGGPLGHQDRARPRGRAQGQRLADDRATDRAGHRLCAQDHQRVARRHALGDRQRAAVADLQCRAERARGVVLVDPPDSEDRDQLARRPLLPDTAPGLDDVPRETAPAVELAGGHVRVVGTGDRRRREDRHDPPFLGRCLAGAAVPGRDPVPIREPAGREIVAQLPHGRPGRDAELGPEALLELAVPRQGQVPCAAEGLQTHQPEVRLLVERVARHEPLEGVCRRLRVAGPLAGRSLVEQQRMVAATETLARVIRPRFEPILREELTAVQLERQRDVAGPCRGLERRRVDP